LSRKTTVINIEKHLLNRRLKEVLLVQHGGKSYNILLIGYVLIPYTVCYWKTEFCKVKSLVIDQHFK